MLSLLQKANLKRSRGGLKESQETIEVELEINLDDQVKKPLSSGAFGLAVQQGFVRLFNDERLADVVLLVAGRRVPAHRLVLNVWSPIFRELLKKCDWKSEEEVVIPLDVDKKDLPHFMLMLKYMYTGETDFVTGDNIMALIRLSHQFQIISLKEVCGQILGELVCAENLLFFLDVVDRYKVEELEAACGWHIAQNFDQLLQEDKLKDLSPTTWAAILKSDDLDVASEEDLFHAVLAYVNQWAEVDKRESIMELLLPHLRFHLMSTKFLQEEVETNPLIMKSPTLFYLLYQAYRIILAQERGWISDNQTSGQDGSPLPPPAFFFHGGRQGAGGGSEAGSPPLLCQRKRTGAFQFDPSFCSFISISEGGTKAIATLGAWYSTKCTPFSPSRPFIQFKLETAATIMIGAAIGSISNSGYAGQYNNAWQVYSHGSLYNSSATTTTTAAYTSGDIIGVGIHFEKGTIHFFKNDAEIAQAKPTLPFGFDLDDPSTLIYPIVSFSSTSAITIQPITSLPPGIVQNKEWGKHQYVKRVRKIEVEEDEEEDLLLSVIKRDMTGRSRSSVTNDNDNKNNNNGDDKNDGDKKDKDGGSKKNKLEAKDLPAKIAGKDRKGNNTTLFKEFEQWAAGPVNKSDS
jgi:hypothetical protein